MVEMKAALRRRFLPPAAAVLDLYCGKGEMYRRAYQGKVALYRGVDYRIVHDSRLCSLMPNEVFVKRHDMGIYNVYDLDAYGCPWKLLYLVLRKRAPGEIALFVTDGLVMHQKVDTAATRMVSATERLPRGLRIPGLNRWYVDLFATMLLDLKRRYGWETAGAWYFHNSRRSVYYWCLQMRKATLQPLDRQTAVVV